jgi:hypothetical protein
VRPAGGNRHYMPVAGIPEGTPPRGHRVPSDASTRTRNLPAAQTETTHRLVDDAEAGRS